MKIDEFDIGARDTAVIRVLEYPVIRVLLRPG
eukprot:SAG31_NODE_2944_length_4874_cov_30.998953_3_plen_32_part_00